jgi:triosephosphate isomerase (TIM)
MKKIIIGNWKMNPEELEKAKRIFDAIKRASLDLKKIDIGIAPPYIYLESLIKKAENSKVQIIAQDVSIFDSEDTSKTGEISISMLKKMGVSRVIVGHSERRKMGEGGQIISQKVKKIIKSGITPILCVGEETREDHGEYLSSLSDQIKSSLISILRKDAKKIIVAYEPVWAIGTGTAMEPTQVQESVIFVRKILADMYGTETAFNIPVLYGGSVNPRNAKDIIEIGEADGLLIGRESLNKEAFAEIIKTVNA